MGQVALETSRVVTFVARLLPEVLGRETPPPAQEGRHRMGMTRETYQAEGHGHSGSGTEPALRPTGKSGKSPWAARPPDSERQEWL